MGSHLYRLLKKAHLLRCSRSPRSNVSVNTPPLVDFSRASHLDLFEQPGIRVFPTACLLLMFGLSSGLDTSRNHDGGQQCVFVLARCLKWQITDSRFRCFCFLGATRPAIPAHQPLHRTAKPRTYLRCLSPLYQCNTRMRHRIPLRQSSTFSCAQNAYSDMFAFIVIVYVKRDLGIHTNTNHEHEIQQPGESANKQ